MGAVRLLGWWQGLAQHVQADGLGGMCGGAGAWNVPPRAMWPEASQLLYLLSCSWERHRRAARTALPWKSRSAAAHCLDRGEMSCLSWGQTAEQVLYRPISHLLRSTHRETELCASNRTLFVMGSLEQLAATFCRQSFTLLLP